MLRHISLALFAIFLIPSWTVAQTTQSATPQTPPQPAAVQLDAGSQAIVEDPVIFRLTQLAMVETSLKLVDEAVKKAGGQANLDAMKASYYQKNNELMDRKAGGPLAWDKFYGKTAEHFFYHPLPHTTYHNPIPTAQRPPQLDYIYKANNDHIEQAKAEIDSLGGKIENLTTRRKQLENKQVALWGRITTAVVAQREIGDRPLYAFHLVGSSTDDAGLVSQRVAAAEALARYIRLIDCSLNYVDTEINYDQASALQILKQNAEVAQKNLVRDLATVESDVRHQTDDLTVIARTLRVVATSAVETRQLAADADAANDQTEKLSSRGLLQTAMLDIGNRTADLDDGIISLVDDQWKLKPATDKPLPDVQLVDDTVRRTTQIQGPDSKQATEPVPTPDPLWTIHGINGRADTTFRVGSVWSNGRGISLTVTERTGSVFRARFESPSRTGEVRGTIANDVISWNFDQLDKGKRGAQLSGKISNNGIQFTDVAGGPYILTLRK